jgi:hypothetical protein
VGRPWSPAIARYALAGQGPTIRGTETGMAGALGGVVAEKYDALARKDAKGAN